MYMLPDIASPFPKEEPMIMIRFCNGLEYEGMFAQPFGSLLSNFAK